MSLAIEYTSDLIQSLADSSHAREEWLSRGRELAQADCARQFEIDDWLVTGEERWSHGIYDDAAAIFTGYAKATLFTFASVARSVESLSRNKDLSWNHHKVVARLGPEKQKELLSRAVKDVLNVSDFRKYVNRECPPPDKPENDPDRPAKLVLVVPPNLLADLERAALVMGEELESAALSLWRIALELPNIWQRLENSGAE